jgi:hypothetical protein
LRVGVLGTLTVLLLSDYIMIAIFGTLALLIIAQQLNFYKIMMILAGFIRNMRKLIFGNRLKLLSVFRGYRGSKLENKSTVCR